MLDFASFVYYLREQNKLRKFRRLIAAGIEKCEPRFREITALHPEPNPGTVEFAHISRYQFAATKLPPGKVLNAACGSGYGNAILGESGHTPVGVDLYDRPLSVARENFPVGEYLQANVLDLSVFASGSFDGVVTFETIEHVQNPIKACEEFKRVLKPNGRLIGSIPIMIFHNPGTNFTWKAALEFVRSNFPGAKLFLQSNHEILDYSAESWQHIRGESDKYLLWSWQKQ